MIINSLDGQGLSDHGDVKPHSSISNGTLSLKCWKFIDFSKMRGNLFKTRSRSSGGRPLVDLKCDCCKNYESLAHILQICMPKNAWIARN